MHMNLNLKVLYLPKKCIFPAILCFFAVNLRKLAVCPWEMLKYFKAQSTYFLSGQMVPRLSITAVDFGAVGTSGRTVIYYLYL